MDENIQELKESMLRLTEVLGSQNNLLENQAKIMMAGMKQEDIERLKLEQVFGRNSAAVDGNTTAVDRNSRAYKANLEAAEEYKKAMDNYAAALKSGADGLKKVFNNMIAQDPSRSMAKYSDGLSTLGDAASKVADNFGPLGKVVGATIQGFTKLASAQMQQVDSLLKANDQLSQFGTAGSFTTKELMDMAHGAGVTSKNMDTLINPIKSLGPALTSLGGTASDGVKAFTSMAKITNEQREQYQRLGVSQEQLLQNQADYVKLQMMSGKSMTNELKDRAALQKASLEYTDNLLTLANLSGQDAESLKKKQQDAARAVEAQVAQIQLESKARRLEAAGRTEEAAVIRKEAEGRKKSIEMMAGFDEGAMKGVREFLSTGTVTSDEGQALARLGLVEELKKLKAEIAAGGDAQKATAKFQDAYNKAMISNVDKVGFAASRSAEVAKAYNITENSLEKANAQRDRNLSNELDASRKKQEEAKKPGKDPAQDARAKMTTVEIEAGKAMDKLVGSINPLLKGFDALTVGGTLAASALLGLAAAAGSKLVGNIAAKGAEAVTKALAGKVAIPAATTVATGAAKAAPAVATAAKAAPAAATAVKAGGMAAKGASVAKSIGPQVIAAAAVAGADAIAGKFGVGKGEVDEKQDDANWEKMSAWEKTQSGLARGIEKLGDLAFMGNMAKQAKMDRIANETKYFEDKDKKAATATSKPEEAPKTPDKESAKKKDESINVLVTNTTAIPVAVVKGLEGLGGMAARPVSTEKAPAGAPKAAVGGVFDGPKSGYPVELHGKEMITPLGSGTKTDSLPAMAGLEEDRDEELEKEIESLKMLKDSLNESDVMFSKLTKSVMKLNELEEDKLEEHEKEVNAMKEARDKLGGVFKNVDIDLTNFTKKIKFATDTSGSGSSTGGGTGISPEAGGTGIKPPSAPMTGAPGMGGATGTGITPPPVKQDVKQNLGDIKASLMKRGMGDEKYLNAVLGNVMKESGGLAKGENLNYSKTSNERIRSIFGSRAAGKSEAELNQIKSSPESMGEFMYGKDTKIGRSMGNLEPGDGFKYRGRGYIQLTGKSNYAAASQAIFGDDTLVKNPDLVNDPKIAADVVAWYMERGKASMAKKMGIDDKNMTQDQANLLATSQIAGVDVRKAGGYLGGEVMQKVAGYAASKDIQGIEPSKPGGTMVAGAKKDDIPKAARGGSFEGPDSGYLVELHGAETVIPDDKIASIAKKELDSVTKMSGSVMNTEGDLPKEVKDFFVLQGQVNSLKSLQETDGRDTFVSRDEETQRSQDRMFAKLDEMMSGLVSKGYDKSWLARGGDDEPTAPSELGARLAKYNDEEESTVTDAMKKIMPAGIATDSGSSVATLPSAELVATASEQLKDVTDNTKTAMMDALRTMQDEFKATLTQIVQKQPESTNTETGKNSISELLSGKLDLMIDKLSQSNSTQDEILKYSKV